MLRGKSTTRGQKARQHNVRKFGVERWEERQSEKLNEMMNLGENTWRLLASPIFYFWGGRR